MQKEGEGGRFGVKSGWLVVDGAVAPRYDSPKPRFCCLPIKFGTVGGILLWLASPNPHTDPDTDQVRTSENVTDDNDRL